MNLFSNKRGFTLIEALVGSAVFLVVALSSYKAFNILMDASAASRATVAATEIANEKFEIIRNLPYSDIGIVGGLPVGKVARNQTASRGAYTFNVLTTVRSVDDTFDGTIGGTPNDTSPADYKLADLDISCTNCKAFTPLKFTTYFSPRSLETALTNGALFAQVIDSNGMPVPGAAIHLVNTQTNPDTIIDETTDNTGWIRIVDAVPGTNAYNITATKSGYSQDQTYPIGGAAGASPVKPDSTVTIQQVTQVNFTIDQLSNLNVTTVDGSCNALPSIGFSLTGTKLIGAPSVLKYPAHTFTTGASGTQSVQNLEWDTYTALLTSASYDLAGTSLLPSFSLAPNTTGNLTLIAVPHTNMALLVSVKDSNGLPINGATVRLQKSPFDQTKTTNSGACSTPGEVFWNGLTSGTYTMTVSKAGYQNSVTSVNVNSAWAHQSVTLTP